MRVVEPGPVRDELEAWLSPERFQLFLAAANHDVDVARRLYEWNASASASFLEVLSYLEVILRNAVDRVLAPLEVSATARFAADKGWWFSSPTFLGSEELKKFDTARSHIRDEGKYNRDKVLSGLTFGFWQSLFGSQYEDLFRHHIHGAFSAPPERFKRKDVSRRLDALRQLRNKVAHHQPVHDFALEESFEQAMDIIQWIDPRAGEWVRGQIDFAALLERRPVAIETLVIVVPAGLAWDLYNSVHAYVCPPDRKFRQVSHVAFYADRAVQPEVAKILMRKELVDWSPGEIDRLHATKDPRDRKLANIIRESRSQGWTGDAYQVFYLSEPGPTGDKQGHVTLSAPIPHSKTGRGSAWVQRHRYATVELLQAAKATSDLDVTSRPVPEAGS